MPCTIVLVDSFGFETMGCGSQLSAIYFLTTAVGDCVAEVTGEDLMLLCLQGMY